MLNEAVKHFLFYLYFSMIYRVVKRTPLYTKPMLCFALSYCSQKLNKIFVQNILMDAFMNHGERKLTFKSHGCSNRHLKIAKKKKHQFIFIGI